MISVRAIYENGVLRLLDPAPFKDGETVTVRIVSEREQVIQSLAEAGLLVEDLGEATPAMTDEEADAVIERISRALAGVEPLAELIIEERGLRA